MTGVQTCALPIYHAQERRGRSMKGESKRSWRKGFDKARTAFACVLTDVLFGRRFHVVIPIEMPLVPKMGTYPRRSEEHTSELQSLMRTSYAVFCLKKKIIQI